MKRFILALIACAFFGIAPPINAQASMDETAKFIDSKPELKKWFEETSRHLQSELTKLAKQAQELKNPEGFGIDRDAKKGKKFDDGELERRRKEALAAIAEYARQPERHLLSLLTAWKFKDYSCLQDRVVRTPPFEIEVFADDHPTKRAGVNAIRIEVTGGKKRMLSQRIGFSSRTLVNKQFAENLTHELTHALLQKRDNEENAENALLPVGPLNLATLKFPIYRYKKFRYVHQEFLSEGMTELRAQLAAATTDTLPPGSSYTTGIGAAMMLLSLDEEGLMRWYVGELTNEEFYNGLRKSLHAALIKNGKFTDEEAQRVTFGLANALLDDRNTVAKELTPHMTQYGEYASTMRSLNRALTEAGYDIREVMDRGGLPAHMVKTFFPPVTPAKK